METGHYVKCVGLTPIALFWQKMHYKLVYLSALIANQSSGIGPPPDVANRGALFTILDKAVLII